MKLEKVFAPVFILLVVGISIGIYFWLNAAVEESLTKNKWCVEMEKGSGTNNCKLVLDFKNDGSVSFILEDGSIANGKWNYNGEVIELSNFDNSKHFEGDYSIDFKNEGTSILVMSSSSVALMAIGYSD